MSARITFLGGAESIGASCLLLEIDDRRWVVDCGIRMKGSGAERLPDLSRLEAEGAPGAILVTHAHLDHIGALPVLHQRFPHVPVYASPPTIDLTRIQLLDSIKIMEEGASVDGELPLYSEATVASLLEAMRPVVPLRPFRPDPAGPEVTFHPAGHILGACSVLVTGRERTVFISGDLSVDGQRSIPGAATPRVRADLAVFESTYGNRLHPPRAEEERRLVETIAAAIEGGGKVLVPAFAIGRAQEVLLILIRAQVAKAVPPFPIHADGMVRRTCEVYARHPRFVHSTLRRRIEKHGDPFFGVLENVRPVRTARERADVMAGPPAVVVASSGMLTGGPSPVYARAWAGDERNLIAITGYQDEESPGRRLLDLARGGTARLILDGAEVEARARVAAYALSGHASGAQIASLARAVGAPDCCLVHGDAGARADLAQLFVRERLGRVCLPAHGEAVEPRSRPGRRLAAGGAGDPGSEALRRLRVTGIGRGPGREAAPGGAPPGEVDFRALAVHLLETYPEERPFTAVELFAVWHGRIPSQDEAEALEERLRSLPEFAVHPSRLFQFLAVRPAEAAGSVLLEVNELCRRIDAELASVEDPGLIRKSFQAGATHMTLVFEFPRLARERLSPILAAVFEGTGWTFDLHPVTNLAAVEREIRAGLPDAALLVRCPSIRLEEEAAVLHLSRALFEEEEAGWAAFRERVRRRTGFTVRWEARARTLPAREARDPEGRLEVNLAYRAIEDAFRREGHRPRRIGRKAAAGGGVAIELAFISPRSASGTGRSWTSWSGRPAGGSRCRRPPTRTPSWRRRGTCSGSSGSGRGRPA